MKKDVNSQGFRFNQGNGFSCLHCHYYVSADAILCGVKNRNHCPYCLWSRHLDLIEAGDRLAACKAGMQPVGLTVKRTNKKYNRQSHGELMLVHACVECGKISINRIAADDDSGAVFEIFAASVHLDAHTRQQLEHHGIRALGLVDRMIVQAQLFGNNWSYSTNLDGLSN